MRELRSQTRTTTAAEASERLYEILNEVDCDGEPVIIESDGTSRAVLISLADFKELRQMQKDRAWEIVEEIRARNAGEQHRLRIPQR